MRNYTILLIFVVSAILGSLIGAFIDSKLGIKPFGTLGLMGLFYLVSWFFVFKIVKKMNAEVKQLKTHKENTTKKKVGGKKKVAKNQLKSKKIIKVKKKG